jgi:hypothetical protein
MLPIGHEVLPAPADEGIARLTGLLAERIRKYLQRRGLGPNTDPKTGGVAGISRNLLKDSVIVARIPS